MILAGNQGKQIKEDPYGISTWRLPSTEFPSEICAILHDRHTDIGACISCNCPDNMQIHELIVTQILIC